MEVQLEAEAEQAARDKAERDRQQAQMASIRHRKR